MKDRLKKIRKTLDLTMEKFGEKVGMKKNTISQLESGKNNITESLIKLICLEFNINEEWLRTGKGEMFKQEKEYSLDEFLKKRNATSLEIEFMKIYFSLDENIRKKIISDFKEAVFKEEFINPKISENAVDEISVTEEDIPKECKNMSVDEITKQIDMWENLLEKKQEEELSALQNTKNA